MRFYSIEKPLDGQWILAIGQKNVKQQKVLLRMELPVYDASRKE